MGEFADRYGGRDPAKVRHMEGQRKPLARRRLARPRVNELQPSDLVGLVSNRWCQRS